MKFENLKVGMKIKAIDDYYVATNKSRRWVGTVTKVRDNGTFIAKTEHSISKVEEGLTYDRLRPEHFEEVVTKKKKIPLKVTNDNDIYVIYKGKVVAKATCIKDDNFNKYNKLFERLKSQQREINRLKEENESFENNMKSVLEIEKKQAVKEFAENLKRKLSNYYKSIDHYCCLVKAVNANDIDELLKEYDK